MLLFTSVFECVCCVVFVQHMMILLLCPPRIKHNLNDTVAPFINSSACQSVSYNSAKPIARQGVTGTYAQQDLHVRGQSPFLLFK